MSREQAYSLVQSTAMKSINDGADFQSLILANHEITDALGREAIAGIFSYDRYLKHVDHIFRRCGII